MRHVLTTKTSCGPEVRWQQRRKSSFLDSATQKKNVKRLGLKDSLDTNVPIYANTKGFTSQQVDFHIKPLFREWGNRKFGEEAMDIVQFLRLYPEALA